VPSTLDETRALQATGIVPRHAMQPAVVGTIRPGTPAYGVLAEGDRVTAIDAAPVAYFDDIPPLVKALGERGGPGMVEVERDGDRLALELTPARNTSGKPNEAAWILGIAPAPAREPVRDAVLRIGPLAAIPAAVRETGFQVKQLYDVVALAFAGRVSVQNTVAGPVTIAKAANDFANKGLATFLNFLALLSVSLAILNLLPIPVLDGGHLLYYLIELATGRPLGDRAMAVGQYLGLALIAGLMGLAFYNDILRMVS
jgi:regulator of sigma E protease